MELDFDWATFDVAVSLEVLSHVADQPAFLRRVSRLLVPGGLLMLGTQNRSALQRNQIPPPRPGQLRRWVDRQELAKLLAEDFRVRELFSITPQFNRGVLRLVNSRKLHALAGRVGLGPASRAMRRLEERLWLGWTLMALAERQA
jgi:cyclopropane fatty-acyl-phospholipid synthase-like methyltransferase